MRDQAPGEIRPEILAQREGFAKWRRYPNPIGRGEEQNIDLQLRPVVETANLVVTS